MKKLVLLVLVGLPFSVFADGGLPDKPYIYVEGKAEIEKPADMVTLGFEIVARNADLAKANQEVQAKATKVLAMGDARKIPESDVLATDLRSAAQYENEDDYGRKRGKIIGYRVARSFAITLRDVTAFPKLVDELLAIDGTEFYEIEAGLSKDQEMQNEVTEKALLNARERAEKTVKTMGMKIDSVFAVSPVAFPEIQSKFLASSSPASRYQLGAQRAKPDPTQYRFAPITVTRNVHILYLISSTK